MRVIEVRLAMLNIALEIDVDKALSCITQKYQINVKYIGNLEIK